MPLITGMQRWVIFALLAGILAGAAIYFYENQPTTHAVEQGY